MFKFEKCLLLIEFKFANMTGIFDGCNSLFGPDN